MIRRGAKISSGKQNAGVSADELEKIALLCQHFRINEADPAVRFFLLSLALARQHVPGFMEPKYSKPRTLQAIMPALDIALRERKREYSAEDVLSGFRQLPGLAHVSTETFERELKRWRQVGKDKE